MRDDLASKGIPADAHDSSARWGLAPDCSQSVDGPTGDEHCRARRCSTWVRWFACDTSRRSSALFGRCSKSFLRRRSTSWAGRIRPTSTFFARRRERLGIADRVVFTGALPRDEAFAYVRAADVCLSPIYPSPMLDVASPTKLVEYMALAKPVIANEHPEQTQVLDASGGGLHVPWDESGLRRL